jgi:hypothetical protein
VVLIEIVKRGKFKRTELPFKQNETTTVRRVLRQMEDFDWLYRTSEHSSIWRAGPKAELLMNFSEDKLKLIHS